MLGSPAGPGGAPQRGLWPLAPAPAPTAASFSTDGLSKYGVYSLFPGGPTFGSALYSHASTIGRFASGHIQQSSGNTFHAAHKVSDSLFSATGYTFGASTPPPGSPYSPIPVAQLELLTKGYSNNIIIQQSAPDFPSSPKKVQITEKKCDEKCCSVQRSQKSQCHCSDSTLRKIQEISATGCSRTNPIEWTGVNVKKEPGTPCQVAEITTSGSPMIKLEVTSPTQKHGGEAGANIGGTIIHGTGAQIPVGIAVARQRVQHEVVASPSLPPAGLLATVNTGGGAQIKEIDNASMAAGTSGVAPGGGTLLQCGDDRTAGLAAWSMGGNHNQTLTTPTLWQYPAAVPVEPMVPMPVPTMPPVGFQLVRDPTTGGLLLLPTTSGIGQFPRLAFPYATKQQNFAEPVQQTVVWPSYPQPSPVLLPSLSSMPPPPLQLLSSASSDYLSSSTTLHQHTQTHSTRLVAVTTDTSKRKIPIPLPATTLIKIETDGTLDQTKALQAVTTLANNNGTVFTEQAVPPLVTTHLIYQHPTANLIVSQTPVLTTETINTTSCRSQATSPVIAGLTPLPESMQIHEEEPITTVSSVQDASNQTDTPICSEDDNTTHTISDVIGEEKGMENCKSVEVPQSEVHHMPVIEETQYTSEEEVKQVGEATSSSSSLSESSDDVPSAKKSEEHEVANSQKPDLSGLELLSNSIVQFELITKPVVASPAAATAPSSQEKVSPSSSPQAAPMSVDDSLGGLDLLCALAEQRIMEENIEKPEKKQKRDKSKERHHKDKERRKEKRKSKKHSSGEPKRKKMKHHSNDKEHRKKDKQYSSREKSDSDKERKCSCQYKQYKTPESEQEVKRFLESKVRQNHCCQGDWPCMNAMELDMRMKLAELQREYREKQKELSKLKPKKHSHDSECSKKKSRKKSTNSERSNTPLPLDNAQDASPKTETIVNLKDDAIQSLKRRRSRSSDSSLEKHSSSSKKRKVGRPKRLSSGRDLAGTETIVAKKPKNSFVGCLLAAKEKLKQQPSSPIDSSPPRYVEEPYTHKLKKVKNNNNTIIVDEIKSSNVRPTLKAEATIKTQDDDEANEWLQQTIEHEEEEEEVIDHIEEDIDEDVEDEENTSNENFSDGLLEKEELLLKENEKMEIEETISEKPKESVPNPCALTETLLEVDKLRVLTAMGGLFYAGKLNAIEPPDVYSITLDGERGNRPHIMSREEILRDAIVEVAPKTTEELTVGTRLCAYWSQQYRCLYPGSAAEPGSPDPQLDGKFVCVEFDDGDSGRIALQDIRLLPPDYPIIEYDPNPLLSLSKRKRRASTSISTEEKHGPEVIKPVSQTFGQCPSWEKLATEQTTSEMERYKEKRRLKKKKKEKMKEKSDDKKKRKKHKCTEEPCPHKRHHKKHKKHRKHHDKSRTDSEGSSKGEFVCQIIDETASELAKQIKPEEKVIVEATVEKIVEDETSTRSSTDDFPNYDAPANPDDEVTMDDILESEESKKGKKFRDRQESCESRSKMSAFLPARQLWHWSGKGYKRPRAKGKSKKCFYKSIQRGKESITVGDAAVFLSTGRPDRPYIGRIEAMWELCGTMVVKVKWFYHPEETIGCPLNLQYPGALFESPHVDENDVQTISHKCEVLPLKEYTKRLGNDPARYATIYDNNDIYYLAGFYDPTNQTLRMEPGIPFTKTD
ncbi:protein winged eye isoform X1 [Euwallacea fornicatus]|uniref:protein winged eye isoform X1 n=1 Tax=Euwallacea fornicatus TaxID=995702 RepID=UPI00338E686C